MSFLFCNFAASNNKTNKYHRVMEYKKLIAIQAGDVLYKRNRSIKKRFEIVSVITAAIMGRHKVKCLHVVLSDGSTHDLIADSCNDSSSFSNNKEAHYYTTKDELTDAVCKEYTEIIDGLTASISAEAKSFNHVINELIEL